MGYVSYSFMTIYGVAANMSDLVDTRFSSYVTDNDQEFGGMNVLNYFENAHQIWFIFNSVVLEIHQLLNILESNTRS